MTYSIQKKEYSYYLNLIKGLTHSPHIHTHLEMIYLRSGKAAAYVDDVRWEFGPGDVFLAFPNQVHYYEVLQPVEAIMVIFAGDMHKDLQLLIENRLPVCPVIHAPQWEESLMGLIALRKTQDPYERLEITGTLLNLFAKLLPMFSYKEVTSDRSSIQKIRAYCEKNYIHPLTLDTLARELYLSPYYISHVLHAQMNMGFNRYINSLRVKQAKKELLASKSISQAALDAGFSSVRTFNRAFRDIEGMTPREYIQKSSGE